MRDLVLTAFLLGSLPFILKRPWYGALLWVWVSVMSPHRLTWGFAYNFQFALLIAGTTLLALFVSKEPKRLPVTPVTICLIMFILWMSFTSLFALYPASAFSMWEKVMKNMVMVLVVMSVLHTKRHVQLLFIVVTLSIAFYGIKGGRFTLLGGGEWRVYGPTGSFIQENNSLALAVLMTIPLLYALRTLWPNRWLRLGLTGSMILCGFSVLGSHSRGALLGMGAMLSWFWMKSRNKFAIALAVIMMVPFAYQFMPEKWKDRMETIETYQEDASAMGRIHTWTMAFNLAKDRPVTGGGFGIWQPESFQRYLPDYHDVHAAHSIYFSVLGEHGFIGLMLFLSLWFLAYREASWVISHSKRLEGWQWATDMARMIQVSWVGYAVGGAFLSLAYYDVPYYLIAVIVLLRTLVEKELKEKGMPLLATMVRPRPAPGPSPQPDMPSAGPGLGPYPRLPARGPRGYAERPGKRREETDHGWPRRPLR